MTLTTTNSDAFEGLSKGYLREYAALSSAIVTESDVLRRALLSRKRSLLRARLSLESDQPISDMFKPPAPKVGFLRRVFLCA